VAESFAKVDTEEKARELFWKAKFEGQDFECPRCCHGRFYSFSARPEVRRCRQCGKDVRLRAGTILEHAKKPLIVWAHAMLLMMQDKRGVSAIQTMRELGLRSYGTAWRMLHKIRRALRQREERYVLKGLVELDGASFSREATDKGENPENPSPRHEGDDKVLIAVESKEWVDDRGRQKPRAGFAKVRVSRESTIFAQQFVNSAIAPGAMVNTDGGSAFLGLQGVDAESQVMDGLPERLDRWLPWVHRFISNAKNWMMGTHHGVGVRYLPNYLGEHTYRFNRRHDPDSLFHRALTACVLATPVRVWALCG
jgi:transposase-like protein